MSLISGQQAALIVRTVFKVQQIFKAEPHGVILKLNKGAGYKKKI